MSVRCRLPPFFQAYFKINCKVFTNISPRRRRRGASPGSQGFATIYGGNLCLISRVYADKEYCSEVNLNDVRIILMNYTFRNVHAILLCIVTLSIYIYSIHVYILYMKY